MDKNIDKEKEEYWKQRRRENKRIWAESHKEHISEYMRKRYANNPEVRARNKLRNKDPQRQAYIRDYMRKYRARKKLQENREKQEENDGVED